MIGAWWDPKFSLREQKQDLFYKISFNLKYSSSYKQQLTLVPLKAIKKKLNIHFKFKPFDILINCSEVLDLFKIKIMLSQTIWFKLRIQQIWSYTLFGFDKYFEFYDMSSFLYSFSAVITFCQHIIVIFNLFIIFATCGMHFLFYYKKKRKNTSNYI